MKFLQSPRNLVLYKNEWVTFFEAYSIMLIFIKSEIRISKSETIFKYKIPNTKQAYYNVFANSYVMLNLFQHLLHETLNQVQGDS